MKIKLLVFLPVFLVFLNACEKKKPSVAFTNATMRPWFDTHCAICHASGGANNANWNYDPGDFDNSIKNNISSIHNEVVTKKTMPDNAVLSASELQKFVDWYNSGFPAN